MCGDSRICIEIRRCDNVKKTEVYPSELNTRKVFFDACRELKAYSGEEFAEFLAEKINSVYGDGVAEFIMDGQRRAEELMRFWYETAVFFVNERERLIAEYTEQYENEVME